MKKRILIIDDDIIFRKIVHKLLCSKYELILTENDKQALGILNSDILPDLIIADVNIPGVEGLDFIKLLLNTKIKSRSIPLIVVTAMEDEKLKNDILQSGVKVYLNKPIERDLFKQEIESLILD